MCLGSNHLLNLNFIYGLHLILVLFFLDKSHVVIEKTQKISELSPMENHCACPKSHPLKLTPRRMPVKRPVESQFLFIYWCFVNPLWENSSELYYWERRKRQNCRDRHSLEYEVFFAPWFSLKETLRITLLKKVDLADGQL